MARAFIPHHTKLANRIPSILLGIAVGIALMVVLWNDYNQSPANRARGEIVKKF